MVEGDGYAGAELIIVGQSPGPKEREEGKPFVGPSGQVLNHALQKAELSRRHNYVTNIVKCFVPPGEQVEPEAVKKCKPLWEKELQQLPKAKTILAVGQEAFNALSGKELKLVHNRKSAESNPRAWLRGSPLKLGDKILLGTLHPSFVMRSGFLNAPTFEHDVRRAAQFASGELTITEDHHTEHPTTREVEEYVQRILTTGEGAVDIETPELSVDEDESDAIIETPISTIGLSADVGESIGVSPDQFGLLDPLFNRENRAQELAPILWVYNGGFDLLHLGKRWRLDGVRPADAMIAFYLLWSDIMSFDFATAASYYCTFGYYKNWRKLQPQLYDTIGNCRDTYGALQIGRACLAEMRKKPINMEPLFWSLMPVIKAVEPWRTKGCRYDTAEGMKMLFMLSETLSAYEKWWSENIPRWEWSSTKQLIEMFTVMGYKVPLRKRNKKGKEPVWTPSVDDEALISLAAKGAEVASLLQTMRALKNASDKVNISGPDGWVRTRAKIHGQTAGRLQLVEENLQQIPEAMIEVEPGKFMVEPRRVIIPDCEEDLILQADYSQIEFFIYGNERYANDPKILEIQESGDYVYGWFYEELYKKPFFIEGKPRKKQWRHPGVAPADLLVVKSYPLGFTYGRFNVPSEFKWLRDWYHQQFRSIQPFHNELIYRATSARFAQTVFGRMRHFPNARGQRNEILSFPGQGTLPDVLFRNAVVPLTDSLPRLFGPRSRVLFTVHDSVICNIQGAGREIKVAKDSIEHVDRTLQQRVPELANRSFACESKIGPSWGEGYLPHKLDSWWERRNAHADGHHT